MPDRAVTLRFENREIPMAWVAPKHACLGVVLGPADIVQPYPANGLFEVVAVWPWLRETIEGKVYFKLV